MRHILDMLDLIKAEVKHSQIAKVVQALDVRDEVIVEVEIGHVGRDGRGEVDARYLVLTET